jgi:hypothetical protein
MSEILRSERHSSLHNSLSFFLNEVSQFPILTGNRWSISWHYIFEAFPPHGSGGRRSPTRWTFQRWSTKNSGVKQTGKLTTKNSKARVWTPSRGQGRNSPHKTYLNATPPLFIAHKEKIIHEIQLPSREHEINEVSLERFAEDKRSIC